MEHAVQLVTDIEGRGDIVAQESEALLLLKTGDVRRRAGDEVVDADDLIILGEEPAGEVRAEEAGGAGD